MHRVWRVLRDLGRKLTNAAAASVGEAVVSGSGMPAFSALDDIVPFRISMLLEGKPQGFEVTNAAYRRAAAEPDRRPDF